MLSPSRRRRRNRLPPCIRPALAPDIQAESWNVEAKADDSPLTRADQEANAIICEGLARIGELPGHPWAGTSE